MTKTETSPVKKITMFLLFLNTFMAEAIFRQRDYLDKSIDLQVLIKIIVWGGTFVFCIYYIRLWLNKMLRVDRFLEISLLIAVVTSCFYAPNPIYSLVAAFTLVTVFLLLFIASALLNNEQILRSAILGSSLVTFLSLIVYFAYPELGRMPDIRGGLNFLGDRLAGITGTANAAGFIAAFCCLALYYYRRYLPNKISLDYWFLVVMNVTALLMTNSRTTLFALIASITIAALFKMTPARLAIFFLAAGLGIAILMTVSIDPLLMMVSRSGNIEEITTGTGRLGIWKDTIELIGQRPWFGWGYASSNYVFSEHSDNLGFVPAHAHNAFLQVFLTNGLIGLILYVGIFIVKLSYAIRSRDQLNIAFVFYLLICGISEPISFGGLAATSTLILATVLSLKYGDTGETYYRTPEQRLPGPAQSAQDASDSEPR